MKIVRGLPLLIISTITGSFLRVLKWLCCHYHHFAMTSFASGSKYGLELFFCFCFKYLYVLCLVSWENPNWGYSDNFICCIVNTFCTQKISMFCTLAKSCNTVCWGAYDFFYNWKLLNPPNCAKKHSLIIAYYICFMAEFGRNNSLQFTSITGFLLCYHTILSCTTVLVINRVQIAFVLLLLP